MIITFFLVLQEESGRSKTVLLEDEDFFCLFQDSLFVFGNTYDMAEVKVKDGQNNHLYTSFFLTDLNVKKKN